jgi:hypothetical protein
MLTPPLSREMELRDGGASAPFAREASVFSTLAEQSLLSWQPVRAGERFGDEWGVADGAGVRADRGELELAGPARRA